LSLLTGTRVPNPNEHLFHPLLLLPYLPPLAASSRLIF
jgi:hypothetical protein